MANYGYYSKILKKPFDTVEDLEKAEQEYREKVIASAKAAAEAAAKKKAEDEAKAAEIQAAKDAVENAKNVVAGVEQELNAVRERYSDALRALYNADAKYQKLVSAKNGEKRYYTIKEVVDDFLNW